MQVFFCHIVHDSILCNVIFGPNIFLVALTDEWPYFMSTFVFIEQLQDEKCGKNIS